MSYHQQNQYHYGSNNRPQHPSQPGQTPPRLPPRSTTDGHADQRASYNYNSSQFQQHGSYVPYSSSAHSNPPSEYSQQPMPPQRPSYAAYPLDSPAIPASSPQLNQYQYRPSPPLQPQTYNPQHYAQPSYPSPSFSNSTQSQYPPAPPPRPPQPYNPATYRSTSNYPDNSIANAVNRMYGPVNSNQISPNQSQQHDPYQNSPISSQIPQQPASGAYSPSPHFARYPSTTSSSPYPQQQSSWNTASAPLPSRAFPKPPVPEQHLGSGSSNSGSNETLPRYPSPGATQADSSFPQQLSPHSQNQTGALSPSTQSSPYIPADMRPTYQSRHSNSSSRQSSDSPRRSFESNDAAGKHPQSRPLPGPPWLEPDVAPTYTAPSEPEHYRHYSDDAEQDRLFDELELAWGGRDYFPSDLEIESSQRTLTQEDRALISNQLTNEQTTQLPGANGNRSSRLRASMINYADYSDDSDAEAAAGLEAMALAAEEELAEERRRQSQIVGEIPNGAKQTPSTNVDESEEHLSDDEDYHMFDIGSFGGGVDVSMSYGGDPNELIAYPPRDGPTTLQNQHPSTSSRGSVQRSLESYPIRSSSNTSLTEYSSYPPTAHVDQSGTGGFADPSLYSRKLSFDDSSESISLEEHAAAGADMSSGPPDLPYSASVSMNRPLPPTPAPPSITSPSSSIFSAASSTFSYDADGYDQSYNLASAHVPRSISMWSHPSTPRPIEPARAKTDGKRQTLRLSTLNVDSSTQPIGLQTPAHMGLDIPTLPPGRRFHPSKLSDRDFENCDEPWALSRITLWLHSLAEGESELRENAIVEALVALFTFKVPNMNITIAEGLAANVMTEMFSAGVLVHEEEWLRFGPGTISGILYQLTGGGCYSPYLHAEENLGRCYSPHCLRMVKKLSLHAQQTPQSTDWATFYNLSKEDQEKGTKKEIELQHNLHEIVTSEDAYMDQLHVIRSLYRDGLASANPAIIAPQMLQSFLRNVFGKLDAVKEANEEHLLPQLKYRQQEQGPWIVGFSDIFRHWIRKAKTAYIEYAANFPNANFLMKHEESRNNMFANFVESARNDKRSNRLGWSSFLRAPITRLQRYSLLLATAQKHMAQESGPELTNLQLALDEIRAVTLECDARVAESGKKADLYDLDSRLVLRPEMKGVELNLQQFGRKILFRGDLQRTGGSRFTWLQTHAILLDNYLVLAKTIANKDSSNDPKYDISKMPIPMDLLILESSNDDPVERSYKGYSAVTSATSESRPGRQGSTATVGGLTQTSTNTSISTLDSAGSSKNIASATVLSEGLSEGKILYPFRIKHLGRETYTLYTSSPESRRTWCEKIIDAKSEHAASLHAQNAEPFQLRVLADSAFAYDTWSGGQKSAMIQGSPLSRAVAEVEKMYDYKSRPGPICRARVNCATTFVQPNGTQLLAIGTDYGVYTAEAGNPRGWIRAIPVLKVTQIAVLEEFNLFLLITDKSLVAYHLDVVCPPNGVPVNSDSVRKAPQKLSGSRDVGFFVTGKMKDRTLVFYKKGTMSSTFKILEPILQRGPERKPRSILNRGSTEFFRDYDDFYIPAECTALDVFTSTLSVATSKGLEILNLDKKTPWSVPDLKAPHVGVIASRISGVTPLAMFRLNDNEFLCVYEECAVYVNKHGDISRSVLMEFVGKAKEAALQNGYLILFDQDFVEIRNAQGGNLKQVIAGHDIRCLDNGRGANPNNSPSARSVKFALQHPDYERTQIVVELKLDETRRL